VADTRLDEDAAWAEGEGDSVQMPRIMQKSRLWGGMTTKDMVKEALVKIGLAFACFIAVGVFFVLGEYLVKLIFGK